MLYLVELYSPHTFFLILFGDVTRKASLHFCSISCECFFFKFIVIKLCVVIHISLCSCKYYFHSIKQNWCCCLRIPSRVFWINIYIFCEIKFELRIERKNIWNDFILLCVEFFQGYQLASDIEYDECDIYEQL